MIFWNVIWNVERWIDHDSQIVCKKSGRSGFFLHTEPIKSMFLDVFWNVHQAERYYIEACKDQVGNSQVKLFFGGSWWSVMAMQERERQREEMQAMQRERAEEP